MIPALIAGAASLGSQIIGSSIQNKQNQRLTDRAQQFELEMWNKSNEYNSPQAQMARLKSAGLNPNLVYGSGNVSGQSSSPAPRAHIPEYKAPVPEQNLAFEVLSAALSTIKTQAETAKVNTEITKNNLDNQNLKEYSAWHPGNLKGQMDVNKNSLLAAELAFKSQELYPYQKQVHNLALKKLQEEYGISKNRNTIGKYDATLAKELYQFKSTNPFLQQILNILKVAGIGK
ncbi:unnamed protein product [Rotaria socialis]|uniref:DNA pilot protein n=1 Tax=Rotaria socialis TaxID=392032 RepID=A0A817TRA5_9BILA|nr:unnamed protein product [Rotaria socialis]CAF4550993.1 unnamed protein product [Rotaria socialis]